MKIRTLVLVLGAIVALPSNAGTVATSLLSRQGESLSQAGGSGENMFGETTDTKTGSTRFNLTDISVPLNSGMRLEFGRRLAVSGGSFELSDSYDNWGGVVGGREPQKEPFGLGWELDIPYIEGSFDARVGWIDNRCSSGTYSAPGVMGLYPFYASHYDPQTYSSGVSVNIPGRTSGPLLSLAAGAPVPTGTGLTYLGGTTDNARFSCIPVKHGTGEGFLATLPDGTRYWFDWLVTRRKPSIVSGGGVGSNSDDAQLPQVVVPLLRAYLYVTRIEDRFGNAIIYDYDPDNPTRLRSISSEGASITVAYNPSGQVASASTAGRTWTYTYAGWSLSEVRLPDGSRWKYSDAWASLGQLFHDTESDVRSMQAHCVVNVGTMQSGATPPIEDVATFSITAPSGVVGTFKFREIIHGDSRAPGACVDTKISWGAWGTVYYYYTAVMTGAPLLNRVGSLYEKQISGPGLQTATWTYAYTPAWSYLSACPDASNCVTKASTSVTAPDGTLTTYLFGNDYQVDSGQLLQTTISKAGVTYQTSTQQNVASAAGYCFPDSLGTDGNVLANPLFSKNRPQLQASVTRDGATFSSAVESFDCMARPSRTHRWSTGMSQNFSRTDEATYFDHLGKWVLGQTRIMTNIDTGKIESQVDYDPATAMPIAEYAFGSLTQTMSYQVNGLLATTRTPSGHATWFSDYKRGTPQTTTNADDTYTTVVVDDNGWVTSSSDALRNVTSFSYDAMGRLIATAYPSGDALAWTGVTKSALQVDVAEYGLPAGHWKETTRIGNGSASVFFDALLHPVLTLTEDLTNPSTRTFLVKRYDSMGREIFIGYPVASLTSVSDALAGSTTTFDPLGRPLQLKQDSELGVLTTTTQYLPGLQKLITNPRGYSTKASFQAFDQPITENAVRIDAPEGVTTVIVRDVFGKTLTLTRSGPEG